MAFSAPDALLLCLFWRLDRRRWRILGRGWCSLRDCALLGAGGAAGSGAGTGLAPYRSLAGALSPE